MKRVVLRIAQISSFRLLRVSAVLTMLALALMLWSMIQPTPMPVMLAMSVGQMIGTIALTLYVIVIVKDLRQVRRARRASMQGAPPSEVADPTAESDTPS